MSMFAVPSHRTRSTDAPERAATSPRSATRGEPQSTEVGPLEAWGLSEDESNDDSDCEGDEGVGDEVSYPSGEQAFHGVVPSGVVIVESNHSCSIVVNSVLRFCQSAAREVEVSMDRYVLPVSVV